MNDEKHEFQKFGQKQIEAIKHLVCGLVASTFGSLWKVLKTLFIDIQKANDNYERFGVIIALAIIGYITFNSLSDIYWSMHRMVHKSWYEEKFLTRAEQEALKFFKLYSEKFEERDCAFMKKVGVDEAMYDKYQTTEYKNYNCDNYYRGINQKFFLPFSIEPIISSDTKLRIRGKALVLRVMENGNLNVGAQFFEIWKTNESDLWRFNATSKEGGKKITNIKATNE